MGFFKDLKELQDSAKELAPDERAEYLMAAGRPGSATIAAIRPTGTVVDHEPECDLDLEVSVDGGEPYPVTHRQTVPEGALAGLKPGASIAVRVDPADPQSLVLA